MRDPGRARSIGPMLKRWREHRRLSQLELSLRASVSARHLSFVETGRSNPSRDMILHLAHELDVPLRDRNVLLLAGGFAPTFSETPLEASRMAAVDSAVRHVLAGHEPNPAVVVDRHWNLVAGNDAVGVFTSVVAPHLLAPPANVLRASLHPEGMAPHIVNLGEWRGHLLHRLRRQAELSADAVLLELHEELNDYPCKDPEPTPDPTGEEAIGIRLRFRHGGTELAFFTVVTVFGTPLDITVAELAIESFFPADAATASALLRPGDSSGM
jgi:transcriptional regulator with XRE-family HTH domain